MGRQFEPVWAHFFQLSQYKPFTHSWAATTFIPKADVRPGEKKKMADDKAEVTRLINLYIDGAGKGNREKLDEAFHSSARWFGTMGGTDYDMDKQGFIDLMVGQPGDGGNLVAKITDIQIDGTAAIATVKEEGFWGIYAFTDYFSLSILDGHWQITNKTFANTGVASA